MYFEHRALKKILYSYSYHTRAASGDACTYVQDPLEPRNRHKQKEEKYHEIEKTTVLNNLLFCIIPFDIIPVQFNISYEAPKTNFWGLNLEDLLVLYCTIGLDKYHDIVHRLVQVLRRN